MSIIGYDPDMDYFLDPQQAIPAGFCDRCGREVYEYGSYLCERCKEEE